MMQGQSKINEMLKPEHMRMLLVYFTHNNNKKITYPLTQLCPIL